MDSHPKSSPRDGIIPKFGMKPQMKKTKSSRRGDASITVGGKLKTAKQSISRAQNQVSIDLEQKGTNSYAKKIRTRSVLNTLNSYSSKKNTRNTEQSVGIKKLTQSKKDLSGNYRYPKPKINPEIWKTNQPKNVDQYY